MAEVELKGVVKQYPGGFVAVRGLDLKVEDGELMVLVGPSGCGKSTSLRMIAGLEEITTGELQIAGRRVNDVAPRDRDIAMVFQSYALYPHMSVYENMAFGLRLRKTPRTEIDERVRGAAATLGIEDLLERKPKALSGGQRQRVAMGRAMVRDPKVFLFDEPLSNLDARLRVQMRVEIARLHRTLKTTMVYVTHDQVEAMTLADRIAIMSEGELQQVGTPLDVYNQPANRFVAGFIGSPAMNFVQGTLASGEGVATFSRGGVEVRLGADKAALLAQTDTDTSTLTIGIRPQHFAPADGDSVADVKGRVEYAERLGAESFVHLEVDGLDHHLVARLPGSRPVTIGEELRLVVDGSAVHIFGADGANLTRANS